MKIKSIEEVEKALEQVNKAKECGIIGDYAIGGGIGAMFYMAPFGTKDLDLFLYLPISTSGIVSLERIYDYFLGLGYMAVDQFIRIEGVDVEFLPPETALEAEALDTAVIDKIGRVPTRVFLPEYLAAIMVRIGNKKYFGRLEYFLEQANLDEQLFLALLSKYNLLDNWNKFLLP